MDKILADYIRRVSEEIKKPVKNIEPLNEDRYPVFPEKPQEYDLPNNPYSEV